MWPSVTQPMSMSCPITTSGIFSLTNLQEEVLIGITTLSREYPSNVQASSFTQILLKKYITPRPALPDVFSSKSLLFITTHFQLSEKIASKTPTQLIFSYQTTYSKFISGTYYSIYSDRSFNVFLMSRLSAFKIGRQNIFSMPRLNSWNGKFPIGSSYEYTSIQKFSGVLGQLLDHGAVRLQFSLGRNTLWKGLWTDIVIQMYLVRIETNGRAVLVRSLIPSAAL